MGPTVVRVKTELEREESELLNHLEMARREWLAARAYFELVSDEDLVDYAIYSVRAAEKKYQYLLRRVRESRNADRRKAIANAMGN